MGCFTSSVKDLDDVKNEELWNAFSKRINSREPLAQKLLEHYEQLTMECRKEIQKPTEKTFTFDSQVNESVEEANQSNLTYEVAKATVSEFIGYTMVQLGKDNWGGNVQSHLHGKSGDELSELTVDGHLEIPVSGGKRNETQEKTFAMKLQFYCAEEDNEE